MGRIAEINARLIEIRGLLAQEGADIDALEQEVQAMTEEKRGLMEQQTRRQQILDQIAGDDTLSGMTQERSFNPTGANTAAAAPQLPKDTPEYRSAFMHHLQGVQLTQAEQRALTSAESSEGHAIPTQTYNMVIRKMIKIAPMLDEITLLQIPGNISLVVEATMTDAGAHAENAEATEAGDKTISVNLGGYEILKLVSISAKLSAMSIDAFEDWLSTILSEGCARKIEDWIINGTGTDEPKGVEKANTWGEANSVTTAATPTYAELCKLVSLLPAEYDPNAKFLMNKKTFWQKVQAIRDDGKAPIVKMENGTIMCLGYPVLISAKVADNVMYLGDYKQYYGNLAAPIKVDSSAASGFRRNATDYRGTAIFDGKPVVGAAFVKGTIGA